MEIDRLMKTLGSIFLMVMAVTALQAQSELLWQADVDSISSSSSARCADLNGDDVLDIVLGAGLDDAASGYGVLAFDGESGELMWKVASANQIFASPIFQDIDGDELPDVFIGGRSSVFYAIKGLDGTVLWSFSAEEQSPADSTWYNFFTPQFVPDQDQDGLQDILCANGGYTVADPDDFNRPPGHLLVLSSADGSLLCRAAMPDGKETYLSPLVRDLDQDGELDLIFGSGGETIAGALWTAELSDLMGNSLAAAISLHSSDSNGYIAPPSLADLNLDGYLDIVTANYTGYLSAIDGLDHSVIWEMQIPDTELSTNPCIGQFTSDEVPDVFVTFSVGAWENYDTFIRMAIDGANGQILFSDTVENFELFSFVACDLNGDAKDEVIHFRQVAELGFVSHQLRAYDIFNHEILDLTEEKQGYNLSSTPWIGDLDGDLQLDLVYAYSREDIPFSSSLLSLSRIQLDAPVPAEIAWGSYMGTRHDGVYRNGIPTSIAAIPDESGAQAAASIRFDQDIQHLLVECIGANCENKQLQLFSLRGELSLDRLVAQGSQEYDLSALPKGLYVYRLSDDGDEPKWGRIVLM